MGTLPWEKEGTCPLRTLAQAQDMTTPPTPEAGCEIGPNDVVFVTAVGQDRPVNGVKTVKVPIPDAMAVRIAAGLGQLRSDNLYDGLQRILSSSGATPDLYTEIKQRNGRSFWRVTLRNGSTTDLFVVPKSGIDYAPLLNTWCEEMLLQYRNEILKDKASYRFQLPGRSFAFTFFRTTDSQVAYQFHQPNVFDGTLVTKEFVESLINKASSNTNKSLRVQCQRAQGWTVISIKTGFHSRGQGFPWITAMLSKGTEYRTTHVRCHGEKSKSGAERGGNRGVPLGGFHFRATEITYGSTPSNF